MFIILFITFYFLRMGHHVITIRLYCSPTSKISVDQQLCWASVVIRWLREACGVKQHIPSFSNEAASLSLSLSLSLQTLAHCFLRCVYVCASLFFHSSHGWLISSYRNKQEMGERYCHGMCCCRFREAVWNLSKPTGSGLLHARAENYIFTFYKDNERGAYLCINLHAVDGWQGIARWLLGIVNIFSTLLC